MSYQQRNEIKISIEKCSSDSNSRIVVQCKKLITGKKLTAEQKHLILKRDRKQQTFSRKFHIPGSASPTYS
jgi:hypothetical protein